MISRLRCTDVDAGAADVAADADGDAAAVSQVEGKAT